ncbi:MAG: LEPR-XLL domain-containing protein, partial [Verrucomicrobiota bacterium]
MKTPTQTEFSKERFALETLEPRVLLAADAVWAGAELASAAATAVVEERISDLPQPTMEPVRYDPFASLEAIFQATDELPLASEFSGKSQAALSASAVPENTPFEFTPDNGKALNATLKIEGSDLLLVDNATQKELNRQALRTISELIINGSEQNDSLTIEKTNSETWFFPVKLNFGGDTDEVGDTLEIRGNPSTEATYLPSKSGGSGQLSLLQISSSTPDQIRFSGLESLVVSHWKSLTEITPGSGDELEITAFGSAASRITGTSDGHELVPLTFSEIENMVLDTGTNDDPLAATPVIKLLAKTADDEVSIHGKVTAAGLKNFTITTGAGADNLFLYSDHFGLAVGGGVFGFNAGAGNDSIFAKNAAAAGNIDANGNGVFAGSTGTIGLTSLENLKNIPDRPIVLVPGLGASFAKDSYVGEWFVKTGLAPEKLTVDPLTLSFFDLTRTLKNSGFREGTSLFIANWDWRLPLAPKDNLIDGQIAGITGSSVSDQTYESAVDYFGYALKQAAERWAAVHGDQRPGSV